MAKTKAEMQRDQEIQSSYMSAQARKQELLKIYKDEDKLSVRISPMYRPYVGNVMVATVNGITVAVPADGTIHKLPRTFADHITGRIAKIDAIIRKTDNMADVANNFESSPGDLNLF